MPSIVINACAKKPGRLFRNKLIVESKSMSRNFMVGVQRFRFQGEKRRSQHVDFKVLSVSQASLGITTEEPGFRIETTSSFEALVYLAVVEGWWVLEGIELLSKDQQELVRCAQGLCSNSKHTHAHA